MTHFEHDLHEQSLSVGRRLARRFGDSHLADDAVAEARLRAWRSAPRHLRGGQLQARMHRTATNAALDELRRRRRAADLRADELLAPQPDEPGAAAARLDAAAALGELTPHQRLLLLLRYEAGLSLAEIGALLEIPPDAARKRIARARASLREILDHAAGATERPTVALLMGNEDPVGYVRWLERAGARVRVIGLARPGLDLAGVDALVLSGSYTDINPRLYGAAPDPRAKPGPIERDLRDLAAMRAALRADLPMIGICRGAQLLNVLFGGDLIQHVDGHEGDRAHPVTTCSDSLTRSLLGRRPDVISDHHQAVGRVGRGLRVAALAPDGLPEVVEVPGRRMAIGLQWHHERGGGDALAEALLQAAVAA